MPSEQSNAPYSGALAMTGITYGLQLTTLAPVQKPLAHHTRDYVPYLGYGIQPTYVVLAHKLLHVVAVQVLLVVRAMVSTLERGPKAFQPIGVDLTIAPLTG